MIRDLDFLVPDDIDIALPLKTAGLFHVHLDGGISTRLYLALLKYRQHMTDGQSNDDALDQLKDIALRIIREDKTHRDMTGQYFDQHLNHFPVIKAFVSTVYQTIGELVSQPGLSLPPIIEDRGGAEDADEQEIMKDIAFVMARTANTYKDIMKMPYVTFACLLKNLVLSEAMKDPDYRKAYERYQMRESLKNGRKSKKKKLDYEALKRFAASL